MNWKTKKLVAKAKVKKLRRKYNTRSRKIKKVKWVILLSISFMAGVILWNYPQFIFEDIYKNIKQNSIIYISPDKEILESKIHNIPQIKFAYINGNWSDEQLKIRIETETQIRQIAKEHNFQYTDYLVKLADCESMLGLKMTNITGNKPNTSIDRGFYMFNSYWQSGVSDKCSYDIRCATEKVMEMINNGSQSLWVCDKIVKGKINFR